MKKTKLELLLLTLQNQQHVSHLRNLKKKKEDVLSSERLNFFSRCKINKKKSQKKNTSIVVPVTTFSFITITVILLNMKSKAYIFSREAILALCSSDHLLIC